MKRNRLFPQNPDLKILLSSENSCCCCFLVFFFQISSDHINSDILLAPIHRSRTTRKRRKSMENDTHFVYLQSAHLSRPPSAGAERTFFLFFLVLGVWLNLCAPANFRPEMKKNIYNITVYKLNPIKTSSLTGYMCVCVFPLSLNHFLGREYWKKQKKRTKFCLSASKSSAAVAERPRLQGVPSLKPAHQSADSICRTEPLGKVVDPALAENKYRPQAQLPRRCIIHAARTHLLAAAAAEH